MRLLLSKSDLLMLLFEYSETTVLILIFSVSFGVTFKSVCCVDASLSSSGTVMPMFILPCPHFFIFGSFLLTNQD